AEQVRRQRCFLIGASAYRLSPLLSRGLNEGFYDAVNLAWKLAGVVNARMSPSVLDTYQQERLSALKAGGGLFELGQTGSLWAEWREKMYWNRQLKRIIRDPARGNPVLSQVSGTSVDYRLSNLSFHHALGSCIRAGD